MTYEPGLAEFKIRPSLFNVFHAFPANISRAHAAAREGRVTQQTAGPRNSNHSNEVLQISFLAILFKPKFMQWMSWKDSTWFCIHGSQMESDSIDHIIAGGVTHTGFARSQVLLHTSLTRQKDNLLFCTLKWPLVYVRFDLDFNLLGYYEDEGHEECEVSHLKGIYHTRD